MNNFNDSDLQSQPMFMNNELLAKWIDLDIQRRIFNAKFGVLVSVKSDGFPQEQAIELTTQTFFQDFVGSAAIVDPV